MPNQLEISGSQHPEKEHRSVPLATTKIFTGYWPNSAPYRDAAVPYLYEKFYGATRNDKIAAGLNTEISPQMTLIRRPGCVVYNSNNFTDVTGFYAFTPFAAGQGEQIIVIADEATGAYIINNNGVSQKTLLYTKSAGAGKTRFKGTGNTLFMANGVDLLKYSWFPSWAPSTTYAIGQTILDSNNNMQICLGYGVKITSTSVTNNICTINYTGTGVVNAGDNILITGVTSATSLQNLLTVVLTAGTGFITINCVTGNYGTAADTGVIVDFTTTAAIVSGPTTQPSWASSLQQTSTENSGGTVAWECWGSPVQNWGIVAPTAAPTVSVVAVTPNPAWAANTYYFPSPLVVDGNSGSGPWVWQLIADGETNVTLPAGFTTGTPTPQYSGGTVNPSPTQIIDGSTSPYTAATWQCNGKAARQTNTPYSVGQVINVSWTYVYYTYVYTGGGGGGHTTYCFNGSVRIKTPSGCADFKSLPYELQIVNENGTFPALRMVFSYKGWMIEFAEGQFVTPEHLYKVDGEWVPASEKYADKPRTWFEGLVYDIHVLSNNEEDHQFILENGEVVHNLSNGNVEQIPHDVTYNCFFQCTVAGTTASTATSAISWGSGLNSLTQDGTGSKVVWQNVGRSITRTDSPTSAPSGGSNTNMVAGNVGDSLLVAINSEVFDGSNSEICVTAGNSGASAPTWSASQGLQTLDGTAPCLTWSNIGSTGAANTGLWFYSYTWVNPVTGDESTASPLSQGILLPASSGVLVDGAGSPDTQVGAINVYRTTQQPVGSVSGTPFFLYQTPAPQNGGNWSWTDTTPDPPIVGSILNIEITAPGYALVNAIVSNFNDPPPAGGTNPEFHAGRMWLTVGNLNYYSTGPDVTSGNGNTSWNVLNFNETPGNQNRLWPTTVGMFVWTNDGLWVIQGLGSISNPFQVIQQVDQTLSIPSYDAFAIDGSQALIYTTDRLYLKCDPQNGVTWLGQAVATDLVASYPPNSAYVTYLSNGLNQQGYITNGSNQWLSWMGVPAPETGYLWNPPATITASGGVGAVQAVKTYSSGNPLFQLLIGPSGTGPILARDTSYSVFTDDGVPYEAWAAFGNLVFAHHGQEAALIFVGADFNLVGSKPKVYVLLDEILNQPTTPSWVAVPNPVNDPTFRNSLAASVTLYQLRYWMVETQEPIYCRSALVKFDFGSDTVKNEMFCFTVFGESETEGDS